MKQRHINVRASGYALVQRYRILLVVVLVVVLFGVAASYVAALAPGPSPLSYQLARQRWEQQGHRHYQVELIWADGWRAGHARVEMRDNQAVSGHNLDTGQRLAPHELLVVQRHASVDALFEVVRVRLWPSLDWRNVVADWHPALRRWLRPCIPPLDAVSYDGALGYPRELLYNDSWCSNSFYTHTRVRIIRFTPLP